MHGLKNEINAASRDGITLWLTKAKEILAKIPKYESEEAQNENIIRWLKVNAEIDFNPQDYKPLEIGELTVQAGEGGTEKSTIEEQNQHVELTEESQKIDTPPLLEELGIERVNKFDEPDFDRLMESLLPFPGIRDSLLSDAWDKIDYEKLNQKTPVELANMYVEANAGLKKALWFFKGSKDAVYVHTNIMVEILLKQNPGWSVSKAIRKISGDLVDIKGFSPSNLFKLLSDKHREKLQNNVVHKKTRLLSTNHEEESTSEESPYSPPRFEEPTTTFQTESEELTETQQFYHQNGNLSKLLEKQSELEETVLALRKQNEELKTAKNNPPSRDQQITDLVTQRDTARNEANEAKKALLARSFQTATNIPEDENDKIKIRHLETNLKYADEKVTARDHVIEELTQKLESFSKLDKHTEEPKIIEWDLSVPGTITKIMGNQGKTIKLKVDGNKVTGVVT